MNLKEVLETIDKVCDLKGDLSGENFYQKVIKPLELIEDFIDSNSGASKGVLFFKGLDVVIKIPFNGSEEEYYDEDRDEYCFREFSATDDYCAEEAVIYQKAKENGIEMLFAETKKVGTVQDYDIYTQPIVKIFYDSTEHTHFNSNDKKYLKVKDSLEKITSKYELYSLPEEWLFNVLKKYGFYMFKKFLNFIKENNVNDLHSGNIGYKNNLPILLDYSGYNG